MNLNFRNILTPLVLGAVLVSCDKKELEEVSPNQSLSSEVTSLATSGNLLFNETFENSTVFSGVYKQFGTSYAFGVASSPVLNGSKSGRFELRDTDPITSGGTRAEILFPYQSNLNRWYVFSVYLPSSDWQYDSKQDVISQWHQGGGKNPSSSLRIKRDRLVYDVRTDPSNPKTIDMGALIKDKWQTFVVHIKHSHNSDGLVEIWQNGVKVVNYAGGNSYDSSFDEPRWKLGIYKSDWNYEETTDTKKRVLYYDDIRLGNENSTFADFSTTTTAPAPAPVEEPAPAPAPVEDTTPVEEPVSTTTSKVVSFTLVNADTEKDIMTITNGATIKLSSLSTRRLTVRANTSPSSVGSVRFNLSGAGSKNGNDNAFPYALFGDNGRGNYYYGTWSPPATGTYTLKATPYSEKDANGTAGTAQTIQFTIVR